MWQISLIRGYKKKKKENEKKKKMKKKMKRNFGLEFFSPVGVCIPTNHSRGMNKTIAFNLSETYSSHADKKELIYGFFK